MNAISTIIHACARPVAASLWTDAWQDEGKRSYLSIGAPMPHLSQGEPSP